MSRKSKHAVISIGKFFRIINSKSFTVQSFMLSSLDFIQIQNFCGSCFIRKCSRKPLLKTLVGKTFWIY